MSHNSSNNSVSPQKGFFKRMLSQDQGRGVKQTEVKQRHPGFVVSNDTAVTPGRVSKPQEVVISPAVRQLSKDGYEVFNTPEKQDIYITIQPESAFFEGEEPRMVRMAGGSFVGARQAASFEAPVRAAPEPEPMDYAQPSDIFANASRREVYDEIDFNEIIIKKNESFEDEIEQEPLFFSPSYKESYDPVFEEQVVTRREPEAAKTSTGAAGAAGADGAEAPFIGYREAPGYDIEEVPIMDICSGLEPVTDVPAGLYVDGHRAVSRAAAGIEAAGHPAFVEAPMEAETAETSGAAATEPVQAAFQPEALAEYFGYLQAQEGEAQAPVAPTGEASETIADVPVTVDVADPVADIMKLTVPGLLMSDDLISELSMGADKAIPEDGLESYDCIFDPIRAPMSAKAAVAAPSGAEAREPRAASYPSVNFRLG